MVTIIKHVALHSVCATNQNSFMAPIMHCCMNKKWAYVQRWSVCHHCWD